MIQKINFTKIITIVGVTILIFLLLNQYENNTSLAKELHKKTIENEKNAEMFEQRNVILIQEQRDMKERIDELVNSDNTIIKEVVKVKTNVVYIRDTTTAKRYINERYGDSTINVVNDLIKGDVCKQEVKLLEKRIVIKDSIITYKDSLIENSKKVSDNLDIALNEIKEANNNNKALYNNSQKELKKSKRKNIFVKLALIAVSVFAVSK